MKKNILNFVMVGICFISIYYMFGNNKEIASIIMQAGTLFFTKVFVSLFPMFIINDLLIYAQLPFCFYKFFNKFFIKVFKTNGIGCYTLLMSLLSGTPSNAYIIKNLVQNNTISVEEANHFLYFTYFSNPLFLFNMLSLLFDNFTTLKIILIHYLSNLVIGLIKRKDAPRISAHNIEINKEKFSTMIIKSINKSVNTLLMILGTITFYMLLTFLITEIINVGYVFKPIIAGGLEITNGLNSLLNLNIISLKIKEIIAIGIISFGGLSIHTQIMSIIEDTNISFSSFFKGRIYQCLISILLIAVF